MRGLKAKEGKVVPHALPPVAFAKTRGGIMEADDRQMTTVQPSFHHRYSTNRVSSVTIVGERAVTPPLVVRHHLVGLVVRRPPRERKIPGSNPACDGIFSGSSHTSDFKVGTPVATLPGAWRYRVSTGAGRPGVRIL